MKQLILSLQILPSCPKVHKKLTVSSLYPWVRYNIKHLFRRTSAANKREMARVRTRQRMLKTVGSHVWQGLLIIVDVDRLPELMAR